MEIEMFALLLIPSLMFVSLFIALGAVAFSNDSHVLKEVSTEPSFELAAYKITAYFGGVYSRLSPRVKLLSKLLLHPICRLRLLTR